MISSVVFVALTAFFAVLSRADPGPVEPEPGSSYPVGGSCTISWSADPDSSSTNPWKKADIYFMTGSDMVQTVLTRMFICCIIDIFRDPKFDIDVTEIDATNSEVTSYSWTCPTVRVSFSAC